MVDVNASGSLQFISDIAIFVLKRDVKLQLTSVPFSALILLVW